MPLTNMKERVLYLAVAALCTGIEGFSTSSGTQRLHCARNFELRSSSGPSEVEALRAAAAKAREEAEKLEQELGRPLSRNAAREKPQKLPIEEVKALVPNVIAESDISKQAEQWQALKADQSLRMFASANLQTFPVSLNRLEERTGLTAEKLGLIQSDASLDEFKYATLWVTGGSTVAAIGSLAILPPNIGATLCYLFALIPILFLGIGSTAPGVIANAIAAIKQEGSAVVTNTPERICRHEAAHLCCGYWCGLPIARTYNTEEGMARVEFDVAASKYSATEVAALSVTALSGAVGEALKYGNAAGAEQDLRTLEGVFSNSAIGSGQARQDLTRWGALTASILLRQNEQQYEKVVEAFQRKAPIEECIAILES